MRNTFKNSVIRVEKNADDTEPRPVEFTHRIDGESGWEKTSIKPNDYLKVVYLGRCTVDGDMFAAYNNKDHILFYKGHLNSGKY